MAGGRASPPSTSTAKPTTGGAIARGAGAPSTSCASCASSAADPWRGEGRAGVRWRGRGRMGVATHIESAAEQATPIHCRRSSMEPMLPLLAGPLLPLLAGRSSAATPRRRPGPARLLSPPVAGGSRWGCAGGGGVWGTGGESGVGRSKQAEKGSLGSRRPAGLRGSRVGLLARPVAG